MFYNYRLNHTYTVQHSGVGPLIVVVTWWDWPAIPTLLPKLINDLDLKVTGPFKPSEQSSAGGEEASPPEEEEAPPVYYGNEVEVSGACDNERREGWAGKGTWK